jgi:adenosylcobinamide-GDP ribazoletransferase
MSRAVIPVMMAFGAPAKSEGLAAAAGKPGRGIWGGALVLGLLVSAISAPSGWLVCLVAAALGAALVAWFAHHNIGGYTGDVLGGGQQVAELFSLTAISSAILAAG